MKNANLRWNGEITSATNQNDGNGPVFFWKLNVLGPFETNLSFEYNAFSGHLIKTNVLHLHMDATTPFHHPNHAFLDECLWQQKRISQTQEFGVHSSVFDDYYESGWEKGDAGG